MRRINNIRVQELLPHVKLQPKEQHHVHIAHAQFSLRFVTLVEVLSVISSVLLTVWAVVPLFPQSRWFVAALPLLSLSLVAYSQYARREGLGEIGFTKHHFFPALYLLALPVSSSALVLLGIGFFTNSVHRSTHFFTNLLIVPFWGVAQQYVLQGFIYRRLRFLIVKEKYPSSSKKWQVHLAILLSASLFALVHLPNLTLALLTLLAATLWCWVYERAPNLWALGLSHGLLSLVLMHSLPSWMLHSMSVGYKHFLYQRF